MSAPKPKRSYPPPPRWSDKLLERFCAPHLLEEVMGDLHERYYLRAQKTGVAGARKKYWREAMAYVRPSNFKRTSSFHTKPISTDMIQNYFKMAVRSMARNKAFSTINIMGLALGLASSLLIFLWVQDELNMDNFHENGDRLYRVYTRIYGDEYLETKYHTPALLPDELKKMIPEVRSASGFARELRLSKPGQVYETFQVGDKIHKMKGSRAGTDFFSMFSYPLLHGTAETALSNLKSVAISRKMANLFFGSAEAAFGETITISNESKQDELAVTAVFEDIPAFSSDQFDYLTNWDDWVQNDDFKKYWGHFGTHTYIQLKADADPLEIEKKLTHFMDTYLGITEDSEYQLALGLQRYGDQYLYGNFENGKPSEGRIVYVHLLSAVAIFILLIACINFMNLKTAQSLKKAREVGIRKVVGSGRWSLICQFMGEALLFTTISVVVAIAVAHMLLPWFNTLTGKQIVLTALDPSVIWMSVGLLLIVGLLAGSYPALFLSSFRPVRALKGTLRQGTKAVRLRKVLVVFQFVLSILLIVATIVVTRQTNFVQNKNLGYERENIIYIPMEGDLLPKYLTFKQEASQLPGVKLVDRSSQTPHRMGFTGPFVRWKGMDESNPVSFVPNSVGYDYVKLMGLEVTEGRDFSQEFPSDTTNFLVSNLAVKQMGLDDPLGSVLSVFGKTGPIVGVINDYHTQSLHQSIMPVVLDIKENLNFGTILVRTQAGRTREALAGLEDLCREFNPGYAFTYSFLDDEYRDQYKSEQTIAKLSNAFGFLAIFISCLGLLGLALFAAEQRVKEMGIRKVLGATANHVFVLFSKDFLKLVGISIILATPLAWFAMNEWLRGFAYHIELTWWFFALAAAFALFIALFTVGFQAIKTAIANPVDSLRSE